MVDFQSRDSRRGRGDEDEADETEEAEESPSESHPQSDGEADASLDEEAVGEAGDGGGIGVAVVTVNGDVTVEEDRAGAAAVEVLEDAGHGVPARDVVAADFDHVQQTLGGLVVRGDVDAIVTLGGDGVGPEDVTVGAARGLFEKTLPGFGELFRSMARESIGTGVVRTRTTAGVLDGVPVFCLPETADAARLGLEDIALPELETLVAECAE